MRVLRKRHSWPPLRVSRATFVKESIDSDPFAYFISPASDRDIYFNDLSAGIDTRTRSRSFSPKSSLNDHMLSSISSSASPTARLKKWIERMELRCFRHSPRISERPMPSPEPPKSPETPIPVSPLARGRSDVRSGSSLRVNRPQQRRPRVWREPSEKIWSVAEEGDEVGLGIVM